MPKGEHVRWWGRSGIETEDLFVNCTHSLPLIFSLWRAGLRINDLKLQNYFYLLSDYFHLLSDYMYFY